MGTHPIFESDFDCLTVLKMSQVSGSSWTPKTASDQVKQTKTVQKLSQGTDELCVDNKFIEAVQDVEFNAQVMVRTQVQLTSIELETDCVCKDTSKQLKL